MVRTIDGDARRRLLAEAVWRVIRRDGFDAASVRNVADEAGLSAGSVRHFFPSQQALHVFAMEALEEEASRRSGDAAAREVGIRPAVRALLRELLPLTDRTRDDYLAHLQFTIRATVDPTIAATARRQLGRLELSYRSAIDALDADGGLAPHIDPERAARRLGILMDGLVLRLITSPELLSREQAGAELDAFLDALAGADATTTAGGAA